MAHFRKQMITLLSSAICDLGCEYCYVPQMNIKEEHKKIDVDFACVAINDYFQQTQNHYIRFFGAGEPTKAFAEMKAIKTYAYKLANGELKTELQTNGYFDDSTADWINMNVNIVWVSFDGLPELQNKQRPLLGGGNSSDVVISNIRKFASNDSIQFGVRVTITNDNFSRQIEIIDYLKSLGVKYICGSPSYSSSANESVSSPQMLEFSKHFAEAYYYAKEYGIFYQTHLMVNFDEEVDVYCRACLPSPHITTDGFVTCCDWALLGSEYLSGSLEKLIYGVYNPVTKSIEYNYERIRGIQRRCVSNLEQGACKDCVALRHCAGGCIGKTIVISNDLYTPSEEWCLATKYLFERLPVKQEKHLCFHS
jgi:radical SAM protein with 4Fe4S-binding SPASM domain